MAKSSTSTSVYDNYAIRYVSKKVHIEIVKILLNIQLVQVERVD